MMPSLFPSRMRALAMLSIVLAACSSEEHKPPSVTPTSASASSTSGAGGDGGGGGGMVCTPGDVVECPYMGPAATQNVGLCVAGAKTCKPDGSAFTECEGEVLPEANEDCGTSVDENCNGAEVETNGVDTMAGCSCTPDEKLPCYTGAQGTEGVGKCVGGEKTCKADGKSFGECVDEVVPVTENCATELDENCNGAEPLADGLDLAGGCTCVPGDLAGCYTGAANTENVGVCVGGMKACASTGKSYGACMGQVVPVAESCATTADENCNGVEAMNDGLDASATCTCVPGDMEPCYTGAMGTQNVGVCIGGMKTCTPTGKSFGTCMGQVLPIAENCGTTFDENCNGVEISTGGLDTTASCLCVPGATASCYTGPLVTKNVGTCSDGLKTCDSTGKAYGAACAGQVTPAVENCTTISDENCNGVELNANGLDSTAGCTCTPGQTSTCYTGPLATRNVGECSDGTAPCTGMGYGACTGDTLPATESCFTVGDEDCNGLSCSEPAWVKPVGDAPDQFGGDVATDSAGNVYWVGHFAGSMSFGGIPLVSAGSNDVFVSKWSPAGTIVWAKRFGSSISDEALGVGVDTQGNAFVLSTTAVDFGGGPKTGLTVAKLDGNTGNHSWSKSCNRTGGGPLSSGSVEGGVAVDPNGNVIIAANVPANTSITCEGGLQLSGSAGGRGILLAKYNTTGTHVWSKTFNDSTDDLLVNGIASDAAGSLWFTGRVTGLNGFGCPGAPLDTTSTSAYLVKLDSTGVCSFQTKFDSPDSEGLGVAVDSLGGPSVVGRFSGSLTIGSALTSAGGDDLFVAKLSSSGAVTWASSFGGPGADVARDVAQDASGNVVVTGSVASAISFGGASIGGSGGTDAFVAKFTGSSGAFLWSTALGGASNDDGFGVVTGGASNLVFASGAFSSAPAAFGALGASASGGMDGYLTRIDP